MERKIMSEGRVQVMLNLFAAGHDTLTIASLMSEDEADVYNALAASRDGGRP